METIIIMDLPARRRVYREWIGRITRRLRTDDFFRDSLILVGATVLAGGIDYLYSIAISRLLTPRLFGSFSAILGLIYVSRIAYIGIEYCVARYAAILDADRLRKFLNGSMRPVAGLSVIFLIVWVIAGPALLGQIVGDVRPLLFIVAGILPVLLVNAVLLGAIRGCEWFPSLGLVRIGLSVTRLAIGVGLVLAGYGVAGAIGATFVAYIIVAVVVYLLIRSRVERSSPSVDLSLTYRDLYQYAAPVTLAAISMTLPTNADVFLVKQAFSPMNAGYYASAAVYGKMLVFLPIGVSEVLFPKVAARAGVSGVNRTMLLQALAVTAALIAVPTIATWVRPTLIVTLLFGSAYAGGAWLLPWYASAIACFSLGFVILNYRLAHGKARYAQVFVVGTLIAMACVYVASDLSRVVQSLLFAYAALFVIGVGIELTARD